MVCLFCRCLNVTVHCKDKEWQTHSVPAGQLFPEASKDRLATNGEVVYEVDLDVAGVFAEHKALLVSRTNGDWVVHRCSNCDTDVYISHVIKESKNFVTGQLMSEANDVQSAKSRKEYSQVFKIIVKERFEEDQDSYSRKRVSSMTFGREDPVMKKLHEQMKSFLTKEQQIMEDRIRKFEETEKDVFSQLQKKTHSERTSLFSSISKARENVITDAIRDSMTITTHTYTEPTRVAPITTIAGTGRLPARRLSSPTERKVTITLTDSMPISVEKVPFKDTDVEEPAMFSLDGFDEGLMDEPDGVDIATGGGVAFPQSDDEEISTDDSSFRDVSDLTTSGGVAMSMPLSIPMYLPQRDDGESEQAMEERRFDPNHVENSIKALALSVQNTSLFGELPRPRMHTSSHRKW